LPDAAAQRTAAREVISRGLSVREAEALVKKLLAQTGKQAAKGRSSELPKDVHTRAAEDRLRFALGTKVRIVRRGKGGRIEVDFGSEAELNRIYEYITSSR
jgi:ParB family chromosome partitioning protein